MLGFDDNIVIKLINNETLILQLEETGLLIKNYWPLK
jgi:hypothetical protein